jgi:hypothetical protein
MTRAWRLLVAAVLTALPVAAHAAQPSLTVPFDFSKHEIGVNVTVKGSPLFMLLDTGVEPSIIDLGRAKALGLPMDTAHGDRGNGFGSARPETFPATITGLMIGNRAFANVDALTLDTEPLSKGYGRVVDGALGYGFLKDKAVLIDYQAATITVLSDGRDADALTRQCRKRYRMPLVFLGDNHWPVILQFRIGAVTAPVTLDTGSSREIGFFQTALQVKAIRGALKVTGIDTGASVGGKFTSTAATLRVPAGFGPFELPAGATVSILPNNGQSDRVIANIGNATFAKLTPKLLLDYAGKTVAFYGDCVR